MLKKTLFLVLPIFISCNYSIAAMPKWINDVDTECNSKNEICAVGRGKTAEEADTNARINIQKFFETKVNSNFTSEVSSNGEKVKNYSYDYVSEENSGILKGVDIVKTFQDKGTYYSLASMNKSITKNELEFEIRMLDKKMKTLLNEDSASSAKKLEDYYHQREDFNKKFMFLSGYPIKEEITYNDIVNNKNKKKKYAKTYYIDNKLDSELVEVIGNVITENHGKVIESKDLADIVIAGKITEKQEYLDVKYFVKYSYNLNLNIYKNGVIVNTLKKKTTETGLDSSQTYSKALNEFTKEIEDKLINLME